MRLMTLEALLYFLDERGKQMSKYVSIDVYFEVFCSDCGDRLIAYLWIWKKRTKSWAM